MINILLRVRKLLTLIITCCLIVTMVAPMTAAAEDISGHWAIDDINFLLEKGLVRGDNNGNISPDNNITRAELIALINRTFEFIEVGETNFPDVEPGTWYYDDLAIAKNQGYIQGDDKGNANPGNPITRAEVAVALARVLELEPQSDASEFADSASFPGWSVNGIIAMTESGIVGGYPDNTFRASNNITRAEAMTILARIIRMLESEEEEIGDEETPLDPLSGSNISGGRPSGGNPGGARTITSFADVNIYTSVETAPTMPAEITAYYSDGSSGNVPVTWDSIDPSQYAFVGTFSIQGTVTETSIRPSATVMVLSNTPVTFLDPNFKEAVVDNLKLLPGYSGYTKDSDLYPVDLVRITSLDASSRGITSMGELSYLINLERLDCVSNQLSELDVSNNAALEVLSCAYNDLKTLDVSNNLALAYLYCDGINLSKLDVSNNLALINLSCGNNSLTTLDVSNNIELQDLRCGDNNIETLDVSNNT
ncbi:MAG: S-layer homology domain-containing protein, partial [Oscillospiraceae bacterium]|nr:S-layer homology domain-containing protein [Oscillospiraceae bacterium]